MRQVSILFRLAASLVLTICFVDTANAETVNNASSDSDNKIYFEEDHLTHDVPHSNTVVYGDDIKEPAYSGTNDFLSATSNEDNIDYPMAEEVKEKSAKPNILAEGAEAGLESINKAGFEAIATVIGIILALLLLIAAGLQGYISFCKPKTGTLTDGTQSGRFGSRILVARLGIFLVSYSGAIVLSAALIFAMAYLSLFLIVAIINGWFVLLFAGNVLSIFIDIVVFTTLAALWMMSIIICRILTEPMIRIFGKYPASGIRITREDAPELYDMILATADECGVEHPTHVNISGKSTQASAMSSQSKVFSNRVTWNSLSAFHCSCCSPYRN